jgi:phospholipid/cholesterol/gamma-HCH transport system permease protein
MQGVFQGMPDVLVNSWTLLVQTLHSILKSPPGKAMVVPHMFNIGNRSLLFLTVTLGFLGIISVYQGCMQAMKVLPDLSMAGAVFIVVMIREFGPTITALMLATRVGSGIAAEIGTMVVTEQIEALKVTNTDPVEYLVAPRFIAFIVMMVACTAYGSLVAIACGTVLAEVRFDLPPATFLSLELTDMSDFYQGLIKTIAYGVVIPIVSAESGFRAFGGSEGVGTATTRAVVNSLFAVIFLDFFIGAIARML